MWVVTVSDRCARGQTSDRSGPLLVKDVSAHGAQVTHRIVSDGIAPVQDVLREAANAGAQLILTTGGTGPGPRDLTPEATAGIITRELPGLAELLRSTGARHLPTAVLSRGISGIIDPLSADHHGQGQTSAAPVAVINLPGSPPGAQQGLACLLPVLPHLLAQLQEGTH